MNKDKLTAHVDANIERRIYLEELRAIVGTSRAHFSRSFSRAFGMSIPAFIGTRRCALARRLLLETALSASEIALCCGFTDQSHFSRLFSKMEGCTPRAYREGQA